MAEDRDTDGKTEEATDKKIHDAIERGDVPVSREVPILASLTAITTATTPQNPNYYSNLTPVPSPTPTPGV